MVPDHALSLLSYSQIYVAGIGIEPDLYGTRFSRAVGVPKRLVPAKNCFVVRADGFEPPPRGSKPRILPLDDTRSKSIYFCVASVAVEGIGPNVRSRLTTGPVAFPAPQVIASPEAPRCVAERKFFCARV